MMPLRLNLFPLTRKLFRCIITLIAQFERGSQLFILRTEKKTKRNAKQRSQYIGGDGSLQLFIFRFVPSVGF